MAKKTEFVKRLYRSETNKILAGVAGGLGEYFTIDPNLIRIIFVLLTVFGGSGVLIYIILWILIPYESDAGRESEETIKMNTKEMSEKAKSFATELKSSSPNSTKNWFGFLIIVLGVLFLFDNLGFLRFHLFWPLLLIALGLFILIREK